MAHQVIAIICTIAALLMCVRPAEAIVSTQKEKAIVSNVAQSIHYNEKIPTTTSANSAIASAKTQIATKATKEDQNTTQGSDDKAKKANSKADRFWNFMSNGLEGRRKFAFGLGGTFGAIECTSAVNASADTQEAFGIDNQFAGFINIYAKFNLIDIRHFFLQ